MYTSYRYGIKAVPLPKIKISGFLHRSRKPRCINKIRFPLKTFRILPRREIRGLGKHCRQVGKHDRLQLVKAEKNRRVRERFLWGREAVERLRAVLIAATHQEKLVKL